MKIKNINSHIFSFMMMFAAIFFLAVGAAVAQSEQSMPEQKGKDAANALESNSCTSARTFTFSSGVQRFAFCVSDHGNIRNLEFPAGSKHITNREGYVVCSGAVTNGFDAGIAEDGWGLPTITQPGGPHTLPLVITRTSTDGKFELKQTFDWDNLAKEIFITMVLKNISASAITDIRLARYFDGDINGNSDNNLYSTSDASVWGQDYSFIIGDYRSLALTGLTFTIPHHARIEAIANWEPFGAQGHTATTCDPATAFNGTNITADYVGRLVYELSTIKAGQSKTVKMVYRRL